MNSQLKQIHILITEDDAAYAEELKEILEEEGYGVTLASDGSEALRVIQSRDFDAGLLDLVMPGIDGMAVLREVSQIAPGTPFIMLTGHGSVDRAVEAVKLGAYDFIEKPASLDRILLTVQRAVEKRHLELNNRRMSREIMDRYAMIGHSAAMQRVYHLIDKVAPAPITTLITGETGTGKELVARAIHLRSKRADGPFVKTNCAAIPESLIESELFGHVKGAFTNATSDKPGKFELAHNGTLFLDEIGDMSLNAQAKILRAIESGEIEPVGGVQIRKVNVRLLAATNQDLEQSAMDGKFRKDLLFRIKGIEITVPPLEARKEDIPDLVRYFTRQCCEEQNTHRVFSVDAIRQLQQRSWTGNVRELRAVVERMVALSDHETIQMSEMEFNTVIEKDRIRNLDYKNAMLVYERELLIQRLAEFDWQVNQAAESLGLDRTNLYKKMKRLGIKK